MTSQFIHEKDISVFKTKCTEQRFEYTKMRMQFPSVPSKRKTRYV